MSRRKGQAAELAIENEAFNRWRILLRHRRFQKSLNRLRRKYQKWITGPPITLYRYDNRHPYVDEFGTEIPREIKRKISRKNVDLYEHECDPNDALVGGIAGAWRDFDSHWGIRLPKAALSDRLPNLSQVTIKQWSAVKSETRAIVPSPVKTRHSRKKWLKLEIDLDYPRDVLLERIEKELSKAMPQRRKARRRWDKFDYYLQVYDLGIQNETFETIARTLKKRVSTVKSAFLSIGRTISSYDPTGFRRIHARHRRAFPTKKQSVLKVIDHKNHVSQCERCAKAETLDEMCLAARLYIHQEYRGQRELPVEDIEEVGAARLKDQTSRRKPALDYEGPPSHS
jgi:hypothetical protein